MGAFSVEAIDEFLTGVLRARIATAALNSKELPKLEGDTKKCFVPPKAGSHVLPARPLTRLFACCQPKVEKPKPQPTNKPPKAPKEVRTACADSLSASCCSTLLVGVVCSRRFRLACPLARRAWSSLRPISPVSSSTLWLLRGRATHAARRVLFSYAATLVGSKGHWLVLVTKQEYANCTLIPWQALTARCLACCACQLRCVR